MAICTIISGLSRSWIFWVRQLLYLIDKQTLKSGNYVNENGMYIALWTQTKR